MRHCLLTSVQAFIVRGLKNINLTILNVPVSDIFKLVLYFVESTVELNELYFIKPSRCSPLY